LNCTIINECSFGRSDDSDGKWIYCCNVNPAVTCSTSYVKERKKKEYVFLTKIINI
jgi:hypothetical protein